MKKTLTKALAIILAVLMMLSVCACAIGTAGNTDDTTKASEKDKDDKKDKKEDEDEDDDDKDDKDEDDEDDDDEDDDDKDDDDESVQLRLKAEKCAVVSGELTVRAVDGGWIYYNENDDYYGILNKEGHKSIGAKYSYVDAVGQYFEFSTAKEDPDYDDADSINIFGLTDCEGNEIIPEEYALIQSINDDFVLAYKAEEKVDYNSDDVLFFFTDSWSFASEPEEDDYCFSGTVDVFSIPEKKSVYQSEEKIFVSYMNLKGLVNIEDADGNDLVFNTKGDEIKDIEYPSMNIFDNGTYQVEKNDKTNMKNSDGKKLFSYSNDDISIYYYYADGDCYLASVMGEEAFVLIGPDGEEITKHIGNDWDFNTYCGGSLLCTYIDDDDEVRYLVCDKKGKKIIDEEFDNGGYNAFADLIYLYNDDGRILVITPDGTKVAETEADEEPVFIEYDGLIEKDDEYYCYAKDSFTVEDGWKVGYFTVADDDDTVIDLLSGEELFDDYQSDCGQIYCDDGFYAMGTNGTGDYLVYHITLDK